jgi:sugar lactone lactonase YvrE
VGLPPSAPLAGGIALVAVLVLVSASWTLGAGGGRNAPSSRTDESGLGGSAPDAATASTPSSSPSPGASPSALFSPSPSATPPPSAAHAASGRFGEGLLIADRGNRRLLIVNDAHRILWRFPGPRSLPAGQGFAADDAFLAPDGKTIVANDEEHQVIDRIDISSRRVVWQYGHYNSPGPWPGYLNTPDDAYPLANGNITVADIRNCRILQISPAKRIVDQLGRTGRCVHDPPFTFDNPNGDTPLADGGLLVTEIGGSRVVRLDRRGRVVFDVHAPVRYPSDAQLDRRGNILVVDYSNPGAVVRLSPAGRVLWAYRPGSRLGRLDHPSLAIPLADGTIALNDDFRDRVVVLDPRSGRIVWQYGRTDVASWSPGHLFIPDGIDVIPVGTPL